VSDITLPELGENIAGGDVLRVLVKPGDTITKDQSLLEIETDKATVDVPSPTAGVVSAIKVKAGDKIKVGQVIVSLEGSGAGAAVPQPAEAAPAPERPSKAAAQPAPAPSTEAAAPESRAARADNVVDISRSSPSARQDRLRPEPRQTAAEFPPAAAAPSARRAARELGVDINDVVGSEADGRISIDDVKAHARRLIEHQPAAVQGAPAAAAEPAPEFSKWGEVERQPMSGVRRKTAEHLSAAWASIPHVTQHDRADITELEDTRKRYAKDVEAAGGALTVTAIAVKICAVALRTFPRFNASIDLAAEEIVLKKYVNIGVAVDTERGLLVPVIRDADKKSITQIAIELTQLSDKARTRKITLDEMQGGTFSVSNLGGIGGTTFTPIVNAPEVAILGISRARIEPVYVERRGPDAERGRGPASSEFAPRLILPLSLSYDHRLIDGADGARFLRWIVQAFEQPFVLALNG
jgi:pyruvate dehydrogenase E2 component (dihydrolipoamide acetyltransferase)